MIMRTIAAEVTIPYTAAIVIAYKYRGRYFLITTSLQSGDVLSWLTINPGF